MKKILKDLKINEVSAVTLPAQAPALARISKSAKVEKNSPGQMLTNDDGSTHQHLVQIYTGTSGVWARTTHEEGHSHAIVMETDENGQVTLVEVGKTNGHTHTVDMERLQSVVDKELKRAKAIEEAHKVTKEKKLKPKVKPKTDDELDAMVQDGESLVDPSDKEKGKNYMDEKLKKLAEMTVGEFAYFKTLSGQDADDYVGSSDRLAFEKARTALDPVVYTATDGTQIRKSAGDQILTLVKKADEQEAELLKAKADNEALELKAIVEKDFGHLPGTVEDRMKLVKAAHETGTVEILKAQNKAQGTAFQSFGVSGGKTDDGKAHPQQEIAERVAEIAKAKNVTTAEATNEFLATPEGSRLYVESRNAR